MSVAAGPVSEWLVATLRQELSRHRVVVWYDPERAFESIFDAFDGEIDKLRWDGSYFALRREVDRLTRSLRQGRQGGRDLLVYVPRQRLTDPLNVLLPLEVLGTAFEAGLVDAALAALGDRVPKAQIREWAALPGTSLEKLDELATAGSDIAPLDVIFGKSTPQQVGFRLLREPDLAAAVDDQGLLKPLRDLLERTYGVAVPAAADSATKLRDAFAQRVLLHEFLDDLDEVPAGLSIYELPAAGQVAACRDLAQQLRETRPLEAEYRRWATAAQQSFSLDRHDYDAAKLGRRDTVEFEERLSLRHVRDLAVAGRWTEALDWARERSASFWATTDERRAGQWLAARIAAELCVRSDRLDSLPKKGSPAEWVARYAEKDGWWQVDRLARRLDSLSHSVTDQPELAELIELARERIHRLEQLLAERFTDAVARTPAGLAELPQQVSVFSKTVAPLTRRGKVAFVLADALRFEMGWELGDLLAEDGGVSLDYAVATPPTLTKIGMAALVPGAEDGVRLVDHAGRLAAEVASRVVATVADRLARFRDQYGGRMTDILLDDVLSAKRGRLAKVVEGADLIVVRSQEIDALGEQGNLFHARTFMSQLIPNLGLAVRRLARAGVAEFVVVADHGYLLREDIGEGMKLERPAGEILEIHRRCAVGRSLDPDADAIVVRAADLGLGADLDLAFPRGINVFKAPGNLVYLHGGLSLQELVIPIVRFTPAQDSDAAAPASVELQVVGEKVVNAFFQVRLRYRAGGDLFEQDRRRRFRVVVVRGRDEVVGQAEQATAGFREAGREVELAGDEESVLMMALTEPLSGKGTVELRALDIELGDIVARAKVPYDIAF